MNSNLQTFLSDNQRKQASLENFQATLDKVMDKAGEKDKQDLRDACESFESYFLQIMFREIRKTSFNEDGLFAKSQTEKIFTDMMDEEISKSLARSGGIGLADQMLRQMTFGV